MGTDSYSYLRETVRTHNAAETAISAVKPTSSYTVVKVEDVARDIATLSEPVPRQYLRDTQLLESYLDGSLRQSVVLRLEEQILSGNGTAPNLRGMRDVTGIQTQAFSTSVIETARKALTLLQNSHFTGGVYVFGADTWEGIELTRTTDGAFLFQTEQGPLDLTTQRLWGQRVVVSPLLNTLNQGVLFAPEAVQLYERENVTISASEAPEGSVVGSSAFEVNEIILRAEGAWGFALLSPLGVCTFATTGV